MKIQSTQNRPVRQQPQRKAYKESRERFEQLAPTAEERYVRGTNLAGVVAIPPALAVAVGGAELLLQVSKLSLSSLPPALEFAVGFGAVAGIMGGTGLGMLATLKTIHKMLAKSPEFEAFRTHHGQVRDAYREELLTAANDEGVTNIFTPRWSIANLQDEDNYSVGGPVRKEAILNTMVDDIEWLLDMRQTKDWRGDIAREQDDPLIARRLIEEEAANPGRP